METQPINILGERDDIKPAPHVPNNGFYPAEHFYNSYPASQFQDFNQRRLEDTPSSLDQLKTNAGIKEEYSDTKESSLGFSHLNSVESGSRDETKLNKYSSTKPNLTKYPKRPMPSNFNSSPADSFTYASTSSPNQYTTSNRYQINYKTTPGSKYVYPTSTSKYNSYPTPTPKYYKYSYSPASPTPKFSYTYSSTPKNKPATGPGMEKPNR